MVRLLLLVEVQGAKAHLVQKSNTLFICFCMATTFCNFFHGMIERKHIRKFPRSPSFRAKMAWERTYSIFEVSSQTLVPLISETCLSEVLPPKSTNTGFRVSCSSSFSSWGKGTWERRQALWRWNAKISRWLIPTREACWNKTILFHSTHGIKIRKPNFSIWEKKAIKTSDITKSKEQKSVLPVHEYEKLFRDHIRWAVIPYLIGWQIFSSIIENLIFRIVLFCFGGNNSNRLSKTILENHDRKFCSWTKGCKTTRVSIRFEKSVCTASIASSGEFTENTPTLEPPLAGFTMARVHWCFLEKWSNNFFVIVSINSQKFGGKRKNPSLAICLLHRYLSNALEQASEPEPIKGILCSSRNFWISPSSQKDHEVQETSGHRFLKIEFFFWKRFCFFLQFEIKVWWRIGIELFGRKAETHFLRSK